MSNDYDTVLVTDPSTDLSWRQHAIELAVRNGLLGQVRITRRHRLSVQPEHWIIEMVCRSATEPTDRTVTYVGPFPDLRDGCVSCDCPAGQFPHRGPCGHVGAAFAFLAGFAPVRRKEHV